MTFWFEKISASRLNSAVEDVKLEVVYLHLIVYADFGMVDVVCWFYYHWKKLGKRWNQTAGICSNFLLQYVCVRTSLQCICCIYFFLLLFHSAVRFQRAKWFPTAILVGCFLRRHSLYTGKAFSSARVCCFSWIASPKERFGSSYQGIYIWF